MNAALPETHSFPRGAPPDDLAAGRKMIRRIDAGAVCMSPDKSASIVPGEQSGGTHFVCQQISLFGSFVPQHAHSLDGEIVLIIEGEFEVFIGRTNPMATSGATLLRKRNLSCIQKYR
jgi:hypothetical protein